MSTKKSQKASSKGPPKEKETPTPKFKSNDVDELKDYRLKLYEQISEQKKAIKMLRRDKQEKVEELGMYANKRQDFQREMRNKNKIIEKKLKM